MAVRGLAYVQLVVEDWPIAVEFYRDVLAFPVEQLFEVEQWASFALAGAKLVVYAGGVGSDRPKGLDRNAFIPNLECDDIDATVADLESRGVPFIAPVADNGEGYKAATFVDPEGNRIQLFEWARPTEGTA
jgi:predicted enzyme related to lactoylglutathione lyase